MIRSGFPRVRHILLGLTFCAALLGGVTHLPEHGWAGSCSDDIARLNAAMKDQYEPWSWSNMFYCAVARGSELRKDALVTRTQIRDIATDVSLAMRLDRTGQEQDCKATLINAKRLLRTR